MGTNLLRIVPITRVNRSFPCARLRLLWPALAVFDSWLPGTRW
ncbi:MAG: hypothetical protein PHN68_07320 [Prolixibacteraceae bacterium]|nr:hypothetical protein [Prolixibacteraceae bacterium]